MNNYSPEKIRLDKLEKQASAKGLILKMQVRKPFKLWIFRLVVAKYSGEDKVQLLGEMKGWAYPGKNGLQLDTIRIKPKIFLGVGALIWTATMTWALENTPCKNARLLAIRDDENRHLKLIRYFRSKGFNPSREIGGGAKDFPLRMIWGGSGLLMNGSCKEVKRKSYNEWENLINQYNS